MIMLSWYRKAQSRVFGVLGKNRGPLKVSDDEDEDEDILQYEWAKRPLHLTPASIAIGRKWLGLARQATISKQNRFMDQDKERKQGRKRPPGKSPKGKVRKK